MNDADDVATMEPLNQSPRGQTKRSAPGSIYDFRVAEIRLRGRLRQTGGRADKVEERRDGAERRRRRGVEIRRTRGLRTAKATRKAGTRRA
ncbi:hypothetical protein NDU88_001725 [Pleurodeles waltl]|uniref:Uncharacterized protein n=1 Tax=Pleurodeles waltl TaxID=8319 RepID=A0AAV7NBM5_PLEWA|nr:hypothetical protein NDU88_001725 [Pleurodeles waltl]